MCDMDSELRDRLTFLLNGYLPGDLVEVVGKPRRKELLGRIGRIKRTWGGAIVEIDGKEYDLNNKNLKRKSKS